MAQYGTFYVETTNVKRICYERSCLYLLKFGQFMCYSGSLDKSKTITENTKPSQRTLKETFQ